MDSSRKAAYLALLAVDNDGAYSNLVLNHVIDSEKPDNPSLVRELVYGVLKNRIFIDSVIDQFAKSGVSKIKKKELNILRIGIYQILFLDSIPEYAAVDETVKLAKKYTYGKDKFVNGLLRNVIRNRDKDFLPKESDTINYLSKKYSVMPWIIELWHKQYDYETIEKILKASNETPKLCIRVNRMKTTREALAEELQQLGYDVELSEIASTGIFCKGQNLLATELYQDGKFSAQDEASQLAALSLDAKPGHKVLDMCAAPGGKTLAIAEGMENQGEITAVDVYEHKLELINKNANRLNIKNIKTKCENSSKIYRKYENSFDRILCDVPCSGLGVIRKKPEIKLGKEISLEELYETQRQILANAGEYLRPGGVIIYSTCTINPEENQKQVEHFLKNHQEYECEFSKQYLPSEDGTDGFYIAKLVRKNIS